MPFSAPRPLSPSVYLSAPRSIAKPSLIPVPTIFPTFLILPLNLIQDSTSPRRHSPNLSSLSLVLNSPKVPKFRSASKLFIPLSSLFDLLQDSLHLPNTDGIGTSLRPLRNRQAQRPRKSVFLRFFNPLDLLVAFSSLSLLGSFSVRT
jgi:hypothetical protein